MYMLTDNNVVLDVKIEIMFSIVALKNPKLLMEPTVAMEMFDIPLASTPGCSGL